MDWASPAALAQNLADVRTRIARAAARSGRPVGAVRLVAITKTVGAEVAAALVGLGVRDIGENRIDGLESKMAALGGRAEGVSWHMVGHLQRNKIRPFLRTGAFFHALDSDRLAEALAEALEKRAAAGGPSGPTGVLVEVNISGEASKGGVSPEDLAAFLDRLRARGALRPIGLMTMAPLAADPEAARPVFRGLRALCERCRERVPELVELSMGMSNDFEVAVEEGATMVRVGTALFEGPSRGPGEEAPGRT